MFDHVRAFYQPATFKEAIRLLHGQDAKACLIAGGTDLALRADRSVTVLVDISRLGLSYITRKAGAIHIGATTTMAALEHSTLMQHFAHGILAKAAASCGSVQTRNMATIGGNLANASPAADTATPLLVLEAQVVFKGLSARHTLQLDAFFSAPHSAIAKNELLIEVVLPPSKPHMAWSFQRLARTEMDIAIVNAAAAIQWDDEHRCTAARLAVGAVAPYPMRVRKAEAVVHGQVLTREVIQNAADAAVLEIHPITDVRASSEYRREITRVLVRRAIEECIEHLELNRLSNQFRSSKGGSR
jgi:carbon-monoxide dehydrogenase medium subunit